MIKMNSELLTGDGVIDTQHQELFYLGEKIKQQAVQNNATEVKRLYEQYLDLLVDHFSYEESLMFQVGYPVEVLKAHQQSHRILQEIYLVAFRPISTGTIDLPTVLELFESRFLMHLWEEDLLLAQFIRSRKSRPSGAFE